MYVIMIITTITRTDRNVEYIINLGRQTTTGVTNKTIKMFIHVTRQGKCTTAGKQYGTTC